MSPDDARTYRNQLTDLKPETRLSAAHALRAVEKSAPDADAVLKDLQDMAANDADVDVRVEAVKAIRAILRSDAAQLADMLQNLLANDKPQVRKQAADYLGQLGLSEPDATKEPLASLHRRLSIESDADVRESIARTIFNITPNREAVITSALESVSKIDTSQLRAAVTLLKVRKLRDEQKNEALNLLWEVLLQVYAVNLLRDLFDGIVSLTSNSDKVVDHLLQDQQLALWKKSNLIVTGSIRRSVNDKLDQGNGEVLSIMLGTLEDSDRSTREEMINWLREKGATQELQGDALKQVIDALWECQQRYQRQGLGAIIYLDGDRAVDRILADSGIAEAAEEVGGVLLAEAGKALDDRWKKSSELRDAIMPFILGALHDSDWKTRQKALYWLKQNIELIPGRFVEKAKIDVKERRDQESEKAVQNSAEEALNVLNRRNRRYLIAQIEASEGDAEEKIRSLVALGTKDALRALVSRWCRWIAEYDRTVLVETIAEAIRREPLAVLPLVDQLPKGLQQGIYVVEGERSAPSPAQGSAPGPAQDSGSTPAPGSASSLVTLRDKIVRQTVPLQYAAAFIKLLDDNEKDISRENQEELYEWIASLESKSGKYSELGERAREKNWTEVKKMKEMARLFVSEEMANRELTVTRRIAKQLSDMSDARYSAENESNDTAKKIEKELKQYAVPVIARRLPGEPDVDIRESLARTLGNMSDPVAVDALAQAVVGEERTRAARQELLARYYLEPSKQRSEEAAAILREAVSEARRTLRLLQGLNIITFLVGMIIVVGGLATALLNETASSRVLGVLAGIGGLAGVITLLVQNPLDRIQNAMSNLVQLETAFTSFIWELNLNGTYIQSRYVAEGVLTSDDVAQTVNRIETAMSLAMNVVAVYTEEGRQRVVTRLHALSPASGESGSSITVLGQFLKGDESQKKSPEGMIAINHVPVKAEDVAWSEHQVKFRLPASLPGLESGIGIVWLSLLIDGMETNSLPFHVMKKTG